MPRFFCGFDIVYRGQPKATIFPQTVIPFPPKVTIHPETPLLLMKGLVLLALNNIKINVNHLDMPQADISRDHRCMFALRETFELLQKLPNVLRLDHPD